MIRFGIVYADESGERFYQANRFGYEFELTAVYDPDMDRARSFAFHKGQLALYDDLSQLTSDERIDAVYLSGPLADHFSIARALLEAGKHVLCSGPLTGDLRQAEELCGLAHDQDLVILAETPSLYTPGFGKMAGYVNSLGTVRYAAFQSCRRHRDYDSLKAGLVRGVFDREKTGGPLMTLAAEPLAAMLRLFGSPEDVKAYGTCSDSGVGLSGNIILKYKDMIGEVVYSAVSDQGVPSQIQGEEASMMIQDLDCIKDLRILRGSVKQVIHFDQADNTLNHLTQAFMEIIRTGSGREKAREDSLALVRILEEAGKQIV